MKMRKLARLFLSLNGALLFSGEMPSAEAAPIYSCNFDGATGTDVAGCTGGNATLIAPDSCKSSVITESTMGAGGFLQVDQREETYVGARITPTGSTNSLKAMTEKPGEQWLVNGGLDVFLRSAEAIKAENALSIIFRSGPKGGLTFTIGSPTPECDLAIRLFGVDTQNAFGPELNTYALEAPLSFQVESGIIYHIGVTFNTDPATGVTTAKLFCKEGTGPIDTHAETDMLASGTFNINEAEVTAGFRAGEYYLGINSGRSFPKTQDFDSYRLYDSDPGTFPAIEGAANAGAEGSHEGTKDTKTDGK